MTHSAIPLPRDWTAVVKSGLVMTVALARRGILDVVAGFASGPRDARLAGELAQLRAEVEQLKQEIQIKDARFSRVEPRRRPHFLPPERLAILELRAARGWTTLETAKRFLVTVVTIAAWSARRDDAGDRALLRTASPVNRYPDCVAEVVRTLKATFPAFGAVRIADILARTGLHLADTTVRRMVKEKPKTPAPTANGGKDAAESLDPAAEAAAKGANPSPRRVTAKAPHHVWHIDLTFVPSFFGLWVPWHWFSAPQCWPFGWWVGGVLDHKTRVLVAARTWKKLPVAREVVVLLEAARRNAGRAPNHVISDQGAQFQDDYRDWCARVGTRPRYGAVYQHGSIAVIERFWRSMKEECFRRVWVPLGVGAFRAELAAYIGWYNDHRPHQGLGGKTPRECLSGQVAARHERRLEPRPKMPIRRGLKARAAPKRVGHLELLVVNKVGLAVLPVVQLRHAA